MSTQRTNLTEAQLVICRQHLRQSYCPMCKSPKHSDQCFCRRCYFSLPIELRLSLWMGRMDHQSLIEWSEKYTAAKDWLRRRGLDDVSGDVFEAIT